MATTDAQARSTVAFQFAAALHAYEEEVECMVVRPRFDPDLYLRVSRRMDEMRTYAASLPAVSAGWLEVLIRHFELTHALWTTQLQPDAAPCLQQLLPESRRAVSRLAQRCLQLVRDEGLAGTA